jgi:hypothetical protein
MATQLRLVAGKMPRMNGSKEIWDLQERGGTYILPLHNGASSRRR